jgi:hypothetical protein
VAKTFPCHWDDTLGTRNSIGEQLGKVMRRICRYPLLIRLCPTPLRDSLPRMTAPNIRTAVRPLEIGDTILVSPPDGSVAWATITALDDDEPNRRIRITVKVDATGEVFTIDTSPDDQFDRPHDADSREAVLVDATDYWKWIGTHVNHPKTGRRVVVMDVRPAQHPKDGRTIVAIVPANGPLIFSERTGHMLRERTVQAANYRRATHRELRWGTA